MELPENSKDSEQSIFFYRNSPIQNGVSDVTFSVNNLTPSLTHLEYHLIT